MTEQIVLEHVTKTFTTKELGSVTAVNDFNLTVHKGECFSFLGPSSVQSVKHNNITIRGSARTFILL